MDLEKRLRASLAAREPPADLADAVVARVLAPKSAGVPLRPRAARWRWPAALAATVLAGAVTLHWQAERARAAESRDQLLLALAITSAKLEQVQQKLVRHDAAASTQENGT